MFLVGVNFLPCLLSPVVSISSRDTCMVTTISLPLPSSSSLFVLLSPLNAVSRFPAVDVFPLSHFLLLPSLPPLSSKARRRPPCCPTSHFNFLHSLPAHRIPSPLPVPASRVGSGQFIHLVAVAVVLTYRTLFFSACPYRVSLPSSSAVPRDFRAGRVLRLFRPLSVRNRWPRSSAGRTMCP